MLPLQLLRDQYAFVRDRLAVKNFAAGEILDKILDTDKQKRETQQALDGLLSESNQLAREIGQLYKSGRAGEADHLKQVTAEKKEQSKVLADTLERLQADLQELQVQLPNLPHISVPKGKHAADNEIVSEHGECPPADPGRLAHWDLAEKYQLIDFELGSKISGAGFPVYRGQGARLQRALINFFLDEAVKAGYEEIQPPYVVNEASAFATGQLPDKEGQMYAVPLDKLYLIPTAEVPVTNIYRDMILRPSDLPIRNVAYSACFRREAGSYGKDVRGLNRLHQFDKVEIVQISQPEHSYDVLDQMLAHAMGLLEKLELPFRVLRLCGGDMSFASALTYDLEVFAGGQQKWLEVSSVSNFESFQANRMKLRIKRDDGKTELAHTLNGSALALPRIVASLLEHHQFGGGINIPPALVPYTGFDLIQ